MGLLSQLPWGKRWGTLWTGCQGKPLTQPFTLWFPPKSRVVKSPVSQMCVVGWLRGSQKEHMLEKHANPGGIKPPCSTMLLQFVHITYFSSHTVVSHGDLQGSMLGPILFSLYVLNWENFIWQHSIYSHYNKGNQMYLSMNPEETECL